MRSYGDTRAGGRNRVRTVFLALATGIVTSPAGASLAAQDLVTCPAEMDPALTGLAGIVRDTLQGMVIPGATVQAAWRDDGGQRRTLSVEADEGGVYVLCGLPPLKGLTVRARFPSFVTEPVLLSIEPGPPAGWDILVGVEEGVLVSLLRVPGRILGRVIDRNSGRPVEAASITLADTLLDENRQRLSDGNGRYMFTDLDPGAYRIQVEHLAFEPVDQVVNLPSDRTVQVDFELSVDPIELAPLVVTAVREKRLELQGFYDRRELGEAAGAGVFITRDEIHDAGAIRVTHYLGRLPGLRTECTGSGNNNCVIRMTRGAPSLNNRAEYGCMNANVYVDGVRVIRDGGGFSDSIDNFVTPSEVAGIEVYRGPSELPAEFGGSVGRCGAIVIWTGPAIAGGSG
ncbi:carboxypeptidase regulatory-like domain-containing protein [Candidatus Palauibacter sp.]|uniref:TonB-dependent receptor n=1 Tax=Candidatus Palauibacter sp. TaxID=3101350 RepID=UPI003AF206E1